MNKIKNHVIFDLVLILSFILLTLSSSAAAVVVISDDNNIGTTTTTTTTTTCQNKVSSKTGDNASDDETTQCIDPTTTVTTSKEDDDDDDEIPINNLDKYDEDTKDDDNDENDDYDDDDYYYEYENDDDDDIDDDDIDDDEYDYDYAKIEDEDEPLFPDLEDGKIKRECVDKFEDCDFWAEKGRCKDDKKFMLVNCKLSCRVCTPKPDCEDEEDACGYWAEIGECEKNPDYMLQSCKESCEVCSPDKEESKEGCVDVDDRCVEWAKSGECKNDPHYMNYFCKKSCNICYNDKAIDLGKLQIIESETDESRQLADLSITYLKNDIFPNSTLSKVHDKCKNYLRNCVSIKMKYGCVLDDDDDDDDYIDDEIDDDMLQKCPLACQACPLLDPMVRCPLGPDDKPALSEPGDLNNLFERILTDESMKQYQPRALSRPYHDPSLPPETTTTSSTPHDYVIGPWVIALETFLTTSECDTIIQLGSDQGFERSGVVGDVQPDGTTLDGYDDDRTSENAWCEFDCYDHPTTKNVLNRIERVTGVPETNFENLQILRYEVGQFYKAHHDYLESDVDFPCGPRILTLYFYLNDVDEGGETDFPLLNVTVTPKRGRAILWTSVLDERPEEIDGRTEHGALPVIEGVKYGANAWIHLRDFKGPANRGC